MTVQPGYVPAIVVNARAHDAPRRSPHTRVDRAPLPISGYFSLGVFSEHWLGSSTRRLAANHIGSVAMGVQSSAIWRWKSVDVGWRCLALFLPNCVSPSAHCLPLVVCLSRVSTIMCVGHRFIIALRIRPLWFQMISRESRISRCPIRGGVFD